jgi:ribonucleotide monophosphatase NagD (HAD superfamily)
MPDKPRLCVDFDGTIFDGIHIFPGCIEALTELRKTYSLAIFSARLTDAERRQMKNILDMNGVPYDEILERKPDAVAYLDDKGIHFDSWSNFLLWGL